MWISIVNFNMVEFNKLSIEQQNKILEEINQLKNTLRGDNINDGQSLPGFQLLRDENDQLIAPDADNIIVKRAWYTESNAQSFVEGVIALTPGIASASYEQDPE